MFGRGRGKRGRGGRYQQIERQIASIRQDLRDTTEVVNGAKLNPDARNRSGEWCKVEP